MQTKSFHRINGWYYVTSQITDSLSQTPFLTVKDFDTLRLETDAFGHSVITGVFLQINRLYGEKPQKEYRKAYRFRFQ